MEGSDLTSAQWPLPWSGLDKALIIRSTMSSIAGRSAGRLLSRQRMPLSVPLALFLAPNTCPSTLVKRRQQPVTSLRFWWVGGESCPRHANLVRPSEKKALSVKTGRGLLLVRRRARSWENGKEMDGPADVCEGRKTWTRQTVRFFFRRDDWNGLPG